MTALGALISRVIALFTNLGSLFIIVMMMHIAADVVMRYVFKSGLTGTIEIVTSYYMIIVGFFSLCFTEEKNRNISVELFADMMPKWVQKHLDGLAWLLSILVFAALMVRNWEEALKKHGVHAYVTSGDTNIPVWPAYYIIPLGTALVLVVVLYKFVCYVTGARSGLDTSLDEVDPDVKPGEAA